MSARFTIDGGDKLEEELSALCRRVSDGVRSIIPERTLEAIVLAGGYGRGEGGVLLTSEGDKPYNDIEFYLFIKGSALMNQRRYGKALNRLADDLSGDAGLHVEFKLDSLTKLRASGVSMFSYDLVSGHRIVWGSEEIFAGGEKHLDSARIPISEGTRLLLNRCTGLLLAGELLERGQLTTQDSDFVGRNLAKAKLAVGDALLTGLHRYHWSVRERHARLETLVGRSRRGENAAKERALGLSPTLSSALEHILRHHATGMKFKLHPQRIDKSIPEFSAEHDELCGLASQVWLWLESRRLQRDFASVGEYALSEKARNGFSWRNYALNARTFGLGALFDPMSRFYPRERLLSSLPLLLRKNEVETKPALRAHLQRQLRTKASDWTELVTAYKQVWSGYA